MCVPHAVGVIAAVITPVTALTSKLCMQLNCSLPGCLSACLLTCFGSASACWLGIVMRAWRGGKRHVCPYPYRTSASASVSTAGCTLCMTHLVLMSVWLQGCVEIMYISLQTIIFTAIVYWMCWFQRDAGEQSFSVPPPPPPPSYWFKRKLRLTMSFSLITLNSVVFSVLFLQQHLLLLKLVAAVGRCEHAP